MDKIEMVDLTTQYARLKDRIDQAVFRVIGSGCYINGADVKAFEEQLASYLGVNHVVECANGTDALTAALMALNLQPGAEVITSAFSFIATAEAMALLKLKPVFADIHPRTFNIDPCSIREKLTPKTKAIVPVHLFGQACPMDEIMTIAKTHNLYVIEDNAQSLGSTYHNGQKTGTIGHIGCTSFFPSKNLGCMGDGGAIFTNDESLAKRLRRIVHHGSDRKYHHAEIGMNSRLDTLQAAILLVKLTELDDFNARRQRAAAFYTETLKGIDHLLTPEVSGQSDHIFHQYTIRVKGGWRDSLQQYLQQNGVPSMIYYPVPLHQQEVFKASKSRHPSLPKSEEAANEVLSLPMHTELTQEQLKQITQTIKHFFATT